MILKKLHPAHAIVVLIGIATIGNLILDVEAGKDHKKLLKDLLSEYNLLERPVHNENETVLVHVGLTILQILEVNIPYSYMESNLWVTLQWTDLGLAWNASAYGGIKQINCYPHRIWRPDILFLSSVESNVDPTFPTKVVITSDGLVTFVGPGIFRSTCRTSMENFPFDEHKCPVKLGSWTADSSKISLGIHESQAEISSYIKNPKWTLAGAPAEVNSRIYACCPDHYMDVTFTIHVKRNGSKIFSENSFWGLWLGALSILLSFLFQTQSGQRIIFGIVILISLSWSTNSMNDDLGGHETMFVFYFRTLAFITFLSIISNALLIYFYNRNPSLHSIPNLIRIIFCEKIPWLICLSRPPPKTSTSSRLGTNLNHSEQYEELVSSMQTTLQRLSGQEAHRHSMNDWQYFAIVMDRLTFLFYVVLIAIYFVAFYSAFAELGLESDN